MSDASSPGDMLPPLPAPPPSPRGWDAVPVTALDALAISLRVALADIEIEKLRRRRRSLAAAGCADGHPDAALQPLIDRVLDRIHVGLGIAPAGE